MKLYLVIALLLVGLARPATAADASTAAAQQAATAWLALVDSGQYTTAWDHAADVVKTQVPRAQFAAAIQGARNKVGRLMSRTLQSATATSSLPNAPPGHYVVILYKTRFANAPSSTETVTPMQMPDGSWKVSGYYIH